MNRREAESGKLPRYVHRVIVKGSAYYYWNPGRGTEQQGSRIRLPDFVKQYPAFDREYRRLIAQQPIESVLTRKRNIVSVADVVSRYRQSSDFTSNITDGTRGAYNAHLNKFVKYWGPLAFRDLKPLAVMEARDAQQSTPTMANQMLRVGRILWSWAIPLELADSNPFEKVKPLDTPDRGNVPWPDWVIDIVTKHAPDDLVRLVQLGVMTAQRQSDLICFGPQQRERHGIWCRPKKTKKARGTFFIPLEPNDEQELDRWEQTPLTFVSTRLKSITQQRNDLYIYSPRGGVCSEASIRCRWYRWLDSDEGKKLCQRWRKWLDECVKRYQWEIDPEDARGPTIHGLRGTGVLLRVATGHSTDQVANDIGMTRQNVDRYMRFRDKVQVAERGRERLKAAG